MHAELPKHFHKIQVPCPPIARRVTPVSLAACSESSGALQKQQSELRLEGAAYPAQPERQEGFSFGYTRKGTEGWIPP